MGLIIVISLLTWMPIQQLFQSQFLSILIYSSVTLGTILLQEKTLIVSLVISFCVLYLSINNYLRQEAGIKIRIPCVYLFVYYQYYTKITRWSLMKLKLKILIGKMVNPLHFQSDQNTISYLFLFLISNRPCAIYDFGRGIAVAGCLVFILLSCKYDSNYLTYQVWRRNIQCKGFMQ